MAMWAPRHESTVLFVNIYSAIGRTSHEKRSVKAIYYVCINNAAASSQRSGVFALGTQPGANMKAVGNVVLRIPVQPVVHGPHESMWINGCDSVLRMHDNSTRSLLRHFDRLQHSVCKQSTDRSPAKCCPNNKSGRRISMLQRLSDTEPKIKIKVDVQSILEQSP